VGWGHGRSRRVRSLLLAVVAVSGLVAIGASAEAAPNDEVYLDDAAVFGPTEAVADRLKDAFGERLSSFWIDRSASPSELVVVVRGARPADAESARTAVDGGRERVRVAPATWAPAQIGQARDRAMSVLAKHGVTPAAVGFNPTTQRLEVKARAIGAEVRGDLANAAGDIPLDVRENPSFDPRPAHVARNQYPPYEAGLELTLTDGTFVGVCTSAFTIFSAATGQFYGTTAGHCGDTGTAVAIGATGVSNIGTNSLWNREPSNSDAARFFIPALSQTDDIYTGGVNGHRDVAGQLNNAGLTAGTRLCYQGVTSGNNNCGNIRADWVDQAVTLNVDGVDHVINHSWCIDWDARPGDSGGPVYRVNANESATAAGIVSFILVESEDPVFGDMCFTSIEWSLAELNGTLVS